MVTIVVDQKLSNSDMYKPRCLETIKNHNNLMVNVMINSSIKLLLKQLWYPLLRGSCTTAQ